VVDLVNQLRAEYGLPPYRIDAALMAAAQAHSEWAASVGTHSHTGPGGSTPTDRAVAAGYGGGRRVRVSENIYWGGLATPESALQWWRNSDIHFRGMTSTQYVDIGAGVAYSESGGFFTLNFGVIVGDAPPPAPAAPGGEAPPEFTIDPIELAEPNEDGSVVHIVGEGQTLWGIADAYDEPLSEILALNRLNEDSIIRPSDQIVIVPVPVEARTEPQGPLIHTVEAGQTLFGIAYTYGVELETILALNGLTEASIIHPGDEILIRPAQATPTPEVTFTPETGPTRAGVALLLPTPAAGEDGSAFGPPHRGKGLKITTRQVLIGTLVLAGLAGVGLMLAGVRMKPD
jgi:LysM repeat protein